MGTLGYIGHAIFGVMLFGLNIQMTQGALYPKESETREVKSLDGIWNFVQSNASNPTEGIREEWFKHDLSKYRPTISMPVPSSYNDITEDHKLRDHVGTVWYDRKFFVPKSWGQNQSVWIRFGSVHYEAHVWINGKHVVKHEIGHLPFEANITDVVRFGQENRVTVLCDNVLVQTTIPQGRVVEEATDGGISAVQTYTFDFFNYAGIHRSVYIFSKPMVYIEDVITSTELVNNVGRVLYNVVVGGVSDDELNLYSVAVQIKDKDGEIVARRSASSDFSGEVDIDNVQPWWPYLMNPNPGYLYTVDVILSSKTNPTLDIYRFKIGIRKLEWDNKQFLINGVPIYFRGFGRHEDSDIRGKGLDLALITKDFNLLKWIGANAYRTSHYPYSEESMDFADENGIMIIDECPSVDTENYSDALLEKHASSIEQLIHRDKNHPSVVMWSIANEPRTGIINADSYFRVIANFTKSVDPTRPITAAIAVDVFSDKAAQFLDIVSFNRYNGWYANPGRLDMITKRVIDDATAWHTKHNKPVLMSEYGADTVEGLHFLPSFVWSEEYQTELFSQHFKAFDKLRQAGFFIGEFVWNFADFKTAQTTTRVGGNKKGVFTRSRQPKAAAHLLRQRYFALGKILDKASYPEDLFLYIADANENASKMHVAHKN